MSGLIKKNTTDRVISKWDLEEYEECRLIAGVGGGILGRDKMTHVYFSLGYHD